MLGRAAYQSPALLADVDARFFGGATRDVEAVWRLISITWRINWRKACR